MKNKKATVPEAALILIAVSVLAYSFYAVAMFNQTVSTVNDPGKLASVYNAQEKFDIYAKEAARLALQQAYAEVLKKPVSCNEQVGLAIVWSDSCRPNNQEVRNKIKREFDEDFKELLNESFSSEIKERLAVSISPIYYEISDKNKFIGYKLNYTHYPSISLDSPEINLEEIYAAAKVKKEKLAVENWTTSVETSGKYYIFTLKTEKSYFYDDLFKPVELKFALKQ